MPPVQNAKKQKAAQKPPPATPKANSKSPPIPKKNSSRKVGRPHKVRPFKAFHTAAAGETRNSPFTNPNIIFFAGGALMIAADIQRIKKVFSYAWGNNALNDAKKNPSDFWANLKVILVQLVFLFLITMSARVIPPLGRMWLIIIIGLWILFIMKNPQILKALQTAGNP